MTLERLRLTYGEPSIRSGWQYLRVQVPDPLEVTYIADHSYAAGSLMSSKQEQFRNRVFETTKALIDQEFKRTGIPVAVLGRARVTNCFLDHLLGKLPSRLRMPWSGDRRLKFAELSELTRPLGFVAGYAYGTSGLNIFGVEQDGVFRFVRSLIILGNPTPNLGDVASTHHGLYSDCCQWFDLTGSEEKLCQPIPAVVDWSLVLRDVPFAGTESDGQVTVRRNVVGYADERANSILGGLYEAELIQMIGRMRSVIADPINPSITPRAWVIAGLPLPGIPAHEVMRLEQLRKKLGIEVAEPKKKGRKTELDWFERVLNLFEQRKKREAIELIVSHFNEIGHPINQESIRSQY